MRLLKILPLMLMLMSVSVFYAQDNTVDLQSTIQIAQLREEISTIRSEVEQLKAKSTLFDFTIGGSAKVIWGLNLWARGGDLDTVPAINTLTPVTHGFDFVNTLLFNMTLGKDIIARSGEKSYNGTQIDIELKINSMGISDMRPDGSWYVVDGFDDQGNPVKIYLPKFESGASNVYFGNFQLVLDKARVSNIFDMGIFINYSDVMEVHKYYGVNSMVEVLKLNHDYFNHGFANGGSLYYAFDDYDYDPIAEESEAVDIWSKSVLYLDPADPIRSRANQRPHGVSFGYDSANMLSNYFRFYIEGGISSKDAFDPKFFSDLYLDYGFFVRTDLLIKDNKAFTFHPKIALAFAFQSDSVEDLDINAGKVFSSSISIPLTYQFNQKDHINVEFDWSINYHIDRSAVTTMIAFYPELTLFNQSFFVKIPFMYSFKNGTDGIIRVGHEDVKWIDQTYDNHYFNLEFIIGFDSQKLFGDMFRYKFTNKMFYTHLKSDTRNINFANQVPPGEHYFYEIIENMFSFYELGDSTWSIKELSLYLNFGLGYTNNARIIRDGFSIDQYLRWGENLALCVETGLSIVLMDNLSFGFSAESPKILVTAINPIGEQASFGLFKIWSEIKF